MSKATKYTLIPMNDPNTTIELPVSRQNINTDTPVSATPVPATPVPATPVTATPIPATQTLQE